MLAANIIEKENSVGEIILLSFDILGEKNIQLGHYHEEEGESSITYTSNGELLLRPLVEEKGLQAIIAQLLSTQEDIIKENQKEINEFDVSKIDWSKESERHEIVLRERLELIFAYIKSKAGVDIPEELIVIQPMTTSKWLRVGSVAAVPLKGLGLILRVITYAKPNGELGINYTVQYFSNHNTYVRRDVKSISRMIIRKINKMKPESLALAQQEMNTAVETLKKYKI